MRGKEAAAASASAPLVMPEMTRPTRGPRRRPRARKATGLLAPTTPLALVDPLSSSSPTASRAPSPAPAAKPVASPTCVTDPLQLQPRPASRGRQQGRGRSSLPPRPGHAPARLPTAPFEGPAGPVVEVIGQEATEPRYSDVSVEVIRPRAHSVAERPRGAPREAYRRFSPSPVPGEAYRRSSPSPGPAKEAPRGRASPSPSGAGPLHRRLEAAMERARSEDRASFRDSESRYDDVKNAEEDTSKPGAPRFSMVDGPGMPTPLSPLASPRSERPNDTSLRRLLLCTDSKMFARGGRRGLTREGRFAPFLSDVAGRAVPVRFHGKDFMLVDSRCNCSFATFLQYVFVHLTEFDEVALVDERALSDFGVRSPGRRKWYLDAKMGQQRLCEALMPRMDSTAPNHSQEVAIFAVAYLAQLHGVPPGLNDFAYPLLACLTHPRSNGLFPDLKECVYAYICIVRLICTYNRKSTLPRFIGLPAREAAKEIIYALDLPLSKLALAGMHVLIGLYLDCRCAEPADMPTVDAQLGVAHLLTPLYAYLSGTLSGRRSFAVEAVPGLSCAVLRNNLGKVLGSFPFKKSSTWDFRQLHRALRAAHRQPYWRRPFVVYRNAFSWSRVSLMRAQRGSPDILDGSRINAEGTREIITGRSGADREMAADLYMVMQMLRKQEDRHFIHLWNKDGYSDLRAEVAFDSKHSRRLQVFEVSAIPPTTGWGNGNNERPLPVHHF